MPHGRKPIRIGSKNRRQGNVTKGVDTIDEAG